MSGRRAIAVRDQHASPFSAILMRFCDATGARAAALVDQEGETVDYAGTVDPFEVKIAAAEWQLVLATLERSQVADWRDTRLLVVRSARRSFAAMALSDGYVLVAVLLRHCFLPSHRALAEAARDLAEEAGLAEVGPERRAFERWASLEVKTDPGDPRRPAAVWVDGSWCPLEVIGRLAAPEGSREIAYRVRLATGPELTLVREPPGRWYSDDLPL